MFCDLNELKFELLVIVEVVTFERITMSAENCG